MLTDFASLWTLQLLRHASEFSRILLQGVGEVDAVCTQILSSLFVFERPGCFGISGDAMRGWLAKLLGNRGENAAARFLRRQRYRILARNCRNHWGEIDIIARDGDWIVFVEVKTRSSHAAGHPAEAVTRSKQVQLTKLALVWLKQRGLLNHRARFDVVAVTWPKGIWSPQIEHFVHAFPAADL